MRLAYLGKLLREGVIRACRIGQLTVGVGPGLHQMRCPSAIHRVQYLLAGGQVV